VSRGASLAEIEAVYRRDFERFASVACAVAGSQAIARDAVQEAFASAVRRRDQFRGDGTLEAWLWAAVVNQARSHRRRRRRLELVERPVEAIAAPDATAAPEPVDGMLDESLASLSERQRLVVFLRYYADLTYEQIAAVLGVKPGTVAATLNAAHARLRPILAEAAS
jgi:RNA polymerase sigma-70 factor (ECF subfamily)